MNQTDYRKILGKNILKLRKSLGLSQTQFADRIGVTAQAVSSYEKGATSPTLDVAIALSNAFDISIDSLCGTEKETEIGLDKPITDNVEAIKMFMRLYDFYGSDMHLEFMRLYDFYGSDMHLETEYCGMNEEKEIFYIDSPYFSRYISDFKKMKELKEQGTIDEELFNNWANSRIEKVVREHDEQMKKAEELVIDDDDFPF